MDRTLQIDDTWLSTLFDRIDQSPWAMPERKDWLLNFAALVAFKAPRVLGGNYGSADAARRICWSLGQLVDDPVWVRRQEVERLDARRKLSSSSANRPGELEDLETDSGLINEFAFEILDAFGILEAIRTAMPSVQDPQDRLFLPEFWNRWWEWAQRQFEARAAAGDTPTGAAPVP